ncbi:uncharacterized protein LOC135830824, partial [Sycon ciliatum]|uniref:uncharacterized protein LOC135830824 n=1 Tax=Sycon ciliatum TaxID=27933 RepID=UPI0031F656D7
MSSPVANTSSSPTSNSGIGRRSNSSAVSNGTLQSTAPGQSTQSSLGPSSSSGRESGLYDSSDTNTTQSTNIDGSIAAASLHSEKAAMPSLAEQPPTEAGMPSKPAAAAPPPPPSKPNVLAGGKVPWTPVTVTCWFMLGIIRGTTAIMLALAGDDIRPTVIVILRSPGTIALFALVMIVWSYNSPALKANMKEVLSTPMTYPKLMVLGVIQSGGPFLLFTYGLTHVPGSFGGAFLASVPVWTVLVDQTLFRALGFKTGKVNALKVLGMITVCVGIVVYIVPTVLYDYSDTIQNECRKNASNSTLSENERRRLCATRQQVAVNIVELICGSILFGLAGVYWRNAKGKIHFTLAGGGQTVVGGILALIFWGALDKGEYSPTWTPSSIAALLYLMIFSGFGAATLLFFLYGKIGAVATARVMCIVPVVSWIEDRIIYYSRGSHGVGLEALGLIILIAGLILFEGRIDQICGINVP